MTRIFIVNANFIFDTLFYCVSYICECESVEYVVPSYLKNLHNGPVTCLCTHSKVGSNGLPTYVHARGPNVVAQSKRNITQCCLKSMYIYARSQPVCVVCLPRKRARICFSLVPSADSRLRLGLPQGLKVFAIVREDHKYAICRGQTTPRRVRARAG